MAGRPNRLKPSFLPLQPDHTFALLVVLLVATFLMGGASRADVESLSLLRPLACLAAAAGVLGLDRATLRAWWLPFGLLAGLAAVMAVQLIPLPPSLWTQLPERETIARLDTAVGLVDHLRPLTLSPMRTANSLASLIVPFAVLVLFCQLGEGRRRQVLLVLVALAALGALVGILQMLAGSESGLYFYAVTHKGAAVGFFANRNHHTVFLAAAMLIALHLALDRARPARDLVSILCFAAAVLLFAGVVGNISRAGLLSAGVALVLVPLVLPPNDPARGAEARAGWLSSRWVRTGLFALPALGVFVLFAFSQRSPALARLLSDEDIEEQRATILPQLVDMVRDVQPWGTGFGAFEQAYRIREPVELVVPNYFNHAHNDWLQLAIEGGIGAIVLLAIALAAIALRVLRLLRGDAIGAHGRSRIWLGFCILIIIGFASLFDYPLRVPSVMAVATIAFALVVGPNLARNQRNG